MKPSVLASIARLVVSPNTSTERSQLRKHSSGPRRKDVLGATLIPNESNKAIKDDPARYRGQIRRAVTASFAT